MCLYNIDVNYHLLIVVQNVLLTYDNDVCNRYKKIS